MIDDKEIEKLDRQERLDVSARAFMAAFLVDTDNQSENNYIVLALQAYTAARALETTREHLVKR